LNDNLRWCASSGVQRRWRKARHHHDRIVDFSLGKQKMDAFDFEINTLRLLTVPRPAVLVFGSKATSTPGSSMFERADPAVDALLQGRDCQYAS
jgi:hypothetical protein